MSAQNPSVCAVCVVSGHTPEMVQLAIESYLSQTYDHKYLVLFDSTGVSFKRPSERRHPDIFYFRADSKPEDTIRTLRNEANGIIDADAIAHFDAGDWSQATRLTRQMSNLRASFGLECVGYREMLFFRPAGTILADDIYKSSVFDEAWLYMNNSPDAALENSLCYWRYAWNEAGGLIDGLKTQAISAMTADVCPPRDGRNEMPRMIGRIHDRNSNVYSPSTRERASQDQRYVERWKRLPEWDRYVAGLMTRRPSAAQQPGRNQPEPASDQAAD